MREDNGLFDSIVVYDKADPSIFKCWLDDINQVIHMTNRSLRKNLIKKSRGVVHQILSIIDHWMDDEIIAKLRQALSLMSTIEQQEKN